MGGPGSGRRKGGAKKSLIGGSSKSLNKVLAYRDKQKKSAANLQKSLIAGHRKKA